MELRTTGVDARRKKHRRPGEKTTSLPHVKKVLQPRAHNSTYDTCGSSKRGGAVRTDCNPSFVAPRAERDHNIDRRGRSCAGRRFMRSSSMPASFADADAAASQQMAEEPRRVSYEPGLKTVPTIEHAGPVRPYYYSAKGFSSVTWHKPGAARPSTIRPNSGDSKVIYGLPSRPGVDDIESTESELRGSYNGRGPAAIIAQRRREEPPLTRSPVPVIVSSDGRSKDLVEPTSHDVVDSRQIQKQLDKKHDTQTPHVDSYNRIIISNAQTAKQTLADRQGHGPETDVPSDSLDSDDSASMEEGDIPMRRYIETMYPPLTGKIEKGASERPGWGVFLRKVLLRDNPTRQISRRRRSQQVQPAPDEWDEA